MKLNFKHKSKARASEVPQTSLAKSGDASSSSLVSRKMRAFSPPQATVNTSDAVADSGKGNVWPRIVNSDS